MNEDDEPVAVICRGSISWGKEQEIIQRKIRSSNIIRKTVAHIFLKNKKTVKMLTQF